MEGLLFVRVWPPLWCWAPSPYGQQLVLGNQLLDQMSLLDGFKRKAQILHDWQKQEWAMLACVPYSLIGPQSLLYGRALSCWAV